MQAILTELNKLSRTKSKAKSNPCINIHASKHLITKVHGGLKCNANYREIKKNNHAVVSEALDRQLKENCKTNLFTYDISRTVNEVK